MKAQLIGAVALCLAVSGCKDEPVKPGIPDRIYSTAVSVSENGAPSYVLPEALVGQSTYQGPTALFTVSGKLSNGALVRLTFSQSSPSAAGADVTDQVEVYSDKAGEATRASGRTSRNAGTNTVSGSFTARFANGTTLDGSLVSLKLP